MEKDKKGKSSKAKLDEEPAAAAVDGEINLTNIQDGIQNIFSREVKDLPIPADIPRLYKGLRIVAQGTPVCAQHDFSDFFESALTCHHI
jgi:hypothetical protein